jgi:hypothetical protein
MTRSPRSAATQGMSPLLQAVRLGALVAFCALPVVGLFMRSLAGRLVWNLVSLLPLVIVLLGYHRWRRICPLYLLSRLPVPLRSQPSRRVPRWLETNAYYISFSLFLGTVWLRLTVMNGDGYAIAIYFVGLIAVAVIFGRVFTGRSWCHYVCPVSFIEKVYTEATSARTLQNSQCSSCSACKKACPDINQDTAYWEEIALPAKRFIYFAFPGVIAGFYLYFYLQSGHWQYLFGGAASQQLGMVRSAFLPGHDAVTAGLFFLPRLPRAVAAAGTLVAASFASFATFCIAEALLLRIGTLSRSSLSRASVQHVLFTASAFLAFVTFYAFAGPVIFVKLPGVLVAFELGILAVASAAFIHRLKRTREAVEVTVRW